MFLLLLFCPKCALCLNIIFFAPYSENSKRFHFGTLACRSDCGLFYPLFTIYSVSSSFLNCFFFYLDRPTFFKKKNRICLLIHFFFREKTTTRFELMIINSKGIESLHLMGNFTQTYIFLYISYLWTISAHHD